VNPSQNMKQLNDREIMSSEKFKSKGALEIVESERPNSVLNQFLKKNVGPMKYKIKNKNVVKIGNKSQKKRKNKTSAIKKIDPGNPKKISKFNNATRNNLGHEKLIPLISVIKRVLNRRLIISTIKNEFDDSRAWLINIQKFAKRRGEFPLIMQIVSQCISTTVEYATSFFKSI
jgi:hypothetical protein